MTDDVDEIAAHSELGPSGAHRWRRCPGSVAMSRPLPDEAGIEAAYGTVFHEFAAHALELRVDAYTFVGMGMEVGRFGWLEFTDEMAAHMQPGLDLIWSMYDEEAGDILLVERRVDISPWTVPRQFGTSDVIIISRARWKMIVWDWKYGAGVPVQPDYNDQAILYALGAWGDYACDIFGDAYYSGEINDLYSMPDVEVEVWIEQPRAPGGGGMWKTVMSELLEIGQQIRKDAQLTQKRDAPLVPGEKQCRFCKAKLICGARAEFVLGQLEVALDTLDVDFLAGNTLVLPKRTMSPEARSQLLLHRRMIVDFLKELHLAALDDAKRGEPTPGLKPVYGRNPARKWADLPKAQKLLTQALGSDAFLPAQLVSPAQAESAVGRKRFAELYAPLVDRGRPKVVLATEDDPRDRIADMHDTLEVDQEEDDDGED